MVRGPLPSAVGEVVHWWDPYTSHYCWGKRGQGTCDLLNTKHDPSGGHVECVWKDNSG